MVERRADVLRALADGPLDQRDLREAVGVSRSTAYKALRELDEAGLVEEGTDGTYRLTQYGRLLRRRHDTYAAGMGRIDDARSVVDALPDDLLVPLAFVERGRVSRAEPYAPERPFGRLEALSAATSEFRCLSPIAVPRYLETIHERVAAGDLRAELLVESPAVDHLASHDSFDDVCTEPGATLLSVERELPFGLFLADDGETVALFSYGADGAVRGALESDAPAAYDWADRQYERFRADATEC